MTETEIQEEVISRMQILLGPPRTTKNAMMLHEEWADDWKLWMYSYSDGDYSLTAYSHRRMMSAIQVHRVLSERKITYKLVGCVEYLLPALRRATVLHDLAAI